MIGNLCLFGFLVDLILLRFPGLRTGWSGFALAVGLPFVVETLQYMLNNGRVVSVEDWLLGSLDGLAAITLVRHLSSESALIRRDDGVRVSR